MDQAEQLHVFFPRLKIDDLGTRKLSLIAAKSCWRSSCATSALLLGKPANDASEVLAQIDTAVKKCYKGEKRSSIWLQFGQLNRSLFAFTGGG